MLEMLEMLRDADGSGVVEYCNDLTTLNQIQPESVTYQTSLVHLGTGKSSSMGVRSYIFFNTLLQLSISSICPLV